MASKVSGVIEKIQTGGSNGTTYAIAATAYGYCDTAANEPAKTVDMDGFKLNEGVTIHVKFENSNTASNPTLNVQSTGAKPIVQYGTTAASTTDETSGWYAGAVLTLTYDGTSWVRDQGFNTNVIFYGTCSTSAGTLEKSVNAIGFNNENLIPGIIVLVKFSVTESSSTTTSSMTLNVNNTGAKPIKFLYNGTYTNLPNRNYLKKDQIYQFIYDGDNWIIQLMQNSNSNTYDRTYMSNNKKARIAIVANSICVGDSTGYAGIDNGITFDITYPILFQPTSIDADAIRSDFYFYYPSITATVNTSGLTHIANGILYLTGNLSGTTFTCDSKILTYTIPTSEDNKIYIPVGINTNATTQSFYFIGGIPQLYWYKNGAFQPYVNTAINALSVALSGITGADDLKAIEAISGTSGLLKKTAENTWTLDTSTYSTTSHDHNNIYYKLDGSNTGTKLCISTQSAAYTNQIQFMNSTTKKGSIGTDNSGILGIYGASKIALRPQLDASTKGIEITSSAIYPTTSITLGTSTAANKWSTVYATTYDGSILKLHQGTAANPSLTGNARIEFDYSDGQPVVISYTPNDSYRSPAGLKIMGGTSATPAWLEVEGPIYADDKKRVPTTGNDTGSLGSTKKPVYVDAGQIKEIGYTIEKSVPSDAIFTDHYAWGDITSKPDTATRWPKWNEISQSGAESLNEGSSNVTDNTEILTSYASNNGFADTNGKGIVYRRDAIKLYNYINGKLGTMAHETASDYAKLASPTFTGTPKSVTPSANSDGTMIATKAYVDGILAANDALVYKGTKAGASASTNGGTLMPAGVQGDTYKVSTAGYINGQYCEVGDMIICVTDVVASTTSNYTTTIASWNIIQTSDGTVSTSETSVTENTIPRYSGATGKFIKKTSVSIDDNNNITTTGSYIENAGGRIQYVQLLPSGAWSNYAADTWYRCCKISAKYPYANFIMQFGGNWSTGAPTMATVSIQMRSTYANITLLHCSYVGNIKAMRLVYSDNNWWLDVQVNMQSSGNMAAPIATFIGNVIVSDINTTITATTDTTSAASIITFKTNYNDNTTYKFNNILNIIDTTASTTTATGALVVSGGVGIGGRTTAQEFNATRQMVISASKVYSNISGSNVLIPAKTGGLFANGVAFANPGLTAANDVGWIRVTGTSESDMAMEIATGDDADTSTGERIVVRQYQGSNVIKKEAVLLEKQTGATTFPVSVTTPALIGSSSIWALNTANNTAGLVVGIESQSYKFGLHMGTGGINHGLYDWHKNGTGSANWVLLADANNNWTFNGNANTATTATTATYLSNIGRQTNMDIDFGTTTYNSKVFISYADGSTTTHKPPSNAMVFNVAWDNINSNHYGGQIAMSNSTNTTLYLRGCYNGEWDSDWKTVLDSSNYTTYAVAKTAGVTAVTWDATNKKLTRTINGTAAEVMNAAQMSTALELGTIASKAATDYLPVKYSNLDYTSTATSMGVYPINSQTHPVTGKTEFGGAIQFGGVSTSNNYYAAQLLISSQSGGTSPVHAYIRRMTSTPDWSNWITLLDNNNTSSGTNNAATLTWNTTYTIAKINGTDIKFTTMAKPTYSDVGAAPSSTVSCTTANVKSVLGTDTSTTNQWLNKKGEWSTPTAAQVGAATSGHNHSGTYVPNTSGANDVNTIVNTGIYNITSGSATNTPKGYGYANLLVLCYRKHTGNTTTDWASQIYLHNGGNSESGSATAPGNVLYYRTSNSNSWFSWRKTVHAPAAYTAIGNSATPVYIDQSGAAIACTDCIAIEILDWT